VSLRLRPALTSRRAGLQQNGSTLERTDCGPRVFPNLSRRTIWRMPHISNVSCGRFHARPRCTRKFGSTHQVRL